MHLISILPPALNVILIRSAFLKIFLKFQNTLMRDWASSLKHVDGYLSVSDSSGLDKVDELFNQSVNCAVCQAHPRGLFNVFQSIQIFVSFSKQRDNYAD